MHFAFPPESRLTKKLRVLPTKVRPIMIKHKLFLSAIALGLCITVQAVAAKVETEDNTTSPTGDFTSGKYSSSSLSQSQKSVAKALRSFVSASGNDKETVTVALDKINASSGKFAAAFDQISVRFPDLTTLSIEQAFTQTQLLNQHFNLLHLGNTRALDPIAEGSGVSKKWDVWVLGSGSFSRVPGERNAERDNTSSGDFLAGADYRWNENFITGLYAGYGYSDSKYSGGSRLQGDSVLFGGYASYSNNGYYADAIIGGGYTDFESRRNIRFSTINRTARGEPDSGLFTASLNLGKDFSLGNFKLGPIVGVQYTHVGVDGYTENGAKSLDLSVSRENSDSLRTTLGGRVAYTWRLSQSVTLIPEVRMFWQREFMNGSHNISASLDGGSGSSFDFKTNAPYGSSAFAGAGVSAQFGESWSGAIFYNVSFGSQHFVNNSISASVNLAF